MQTLPEAGRSLLGVAHPGIDAVSAAVQEFRDSQGLFVGPVLRDLQGANGGIVGSEPGGDLFRDGSPRARPGHAR